jgi:hypothetical protein
MNKLLALTGLLALLVVGGLLVAADEKKEPPPKGTLPPKWKDLGLSDTQKKDIYSIQADFHGKISDLEAQIKKLKDDEHDKLINVLTDDQKKHLRELKDPIPDKGSSSSSTSSSTTSSSSSPSSSSSK